MEVRGQGIEVGDIVLGYHKGYWKVLKAGRTIEYQRVDVKPGSKPVIKSCDRGWCTKIDPESQYYQQIKDAYELMDMLMKAKAGV